MSDTLRIFVQRVMLSDGSDVYDLIIGMDDSCDGRTILRAVTWGDAWRCADTIKASVEAHTLNSVKVLEALP